MEHTASMIRSDEDWVMELKNGNPRAMEFLYMRYYKKVYLKCLTFAKDTEVAKDLAQDVMIKVMEKVVFFRHESRFSTWLYRITVNFLIDQTRKRVMIHSPFSADLPLAEEDTIASEARDFLLDKLDELLRSASTDEWKLLQEKYLHQMSIDELTKRYQVSQSAMKMRLLRARAYAAQSITSHQTFITSKP